MRSIKPLNNHDDKSYIMDPDADVCFEVSWEVCNKVGGIFTVVSSKVSQMIEHYKDNYFLVGPYFPQKIYGIFEETLAPEGCRTALEKLKKEGIEVHCGTWLTKGNPHVLLIDFSNFAKNKNEIKKELWDNYKIDSLYTEYFDFDEPVIWAYAVGKVIESLKPSFNNKKIVAQFHEWLSGAGLLYLKSRKARIGTVFTTHATMLGRTLASEDINLYEILNKINPDEEAKKRGPSIFAKFQMEKQCALNANVFTTVSEITGIEAEKLLSRKPDVILPNGLDMSKFPTFEQSSVKHKIFKNRIKYFLMTYFFPYYSFNIDNTLIYFLAGRYEFHDKGIDVFIKALGELNLMLKKEKSNKTIVAFFWVPGNIRAIKPALLESKTLLNDIKDEVDDLSEDIKNKIINLLVSQKEISKKELFDEDNLEDFKRKTLRLLRKGVPPASTHDLYNEDSDQILNAFKQAGLNNLKEDPVKVIFYPIYLSGADGLLDTSYYESMQGAHLGVFPSYYEPWGYTPLEGGALGVSSVTTDLSGFGRFICKECATQKYPGIFVLKRYQKKDDQVIKDLAGFMYKFAKFNAQERTENKITAQKIALMADWKNFIENYIKAHNLAVSRI